MIRLYSIDDVIRNIDNVVVNKVDGHLVNIQVIFQLSNTDIVSCFLSSLIDSINLVLIGETLRKKKYSDHSR